MFDIEKRFRMFSQWRNRREVVSSSKFMLGRGRPESARAERSALESRRLYKKRKKRDPRPLHDRLEERRPQTVQ